MYSGIFIVTYVLENLFDYILTILLHSLILSIDLSFFCFKVFIFKTNNKDFGSTSTNVKQYP